LSLFGNKNCSNPTGSPAYSSLSSSRFIQVSQHGSGLLRPEDEKTGQEQAYQVLVSLFPRSGKPSNYRQEANRIVHPGIPRCTTKALPRA
jgi:hypothetical protein